MKAYEFRCGGDWGAWECLVDVLLTEEEENLLKEHAKNNEFLEKFPPTDKLYKKVMKALKAQCESGTKLNSVVIWMPSGLRDDGL